MAKIPKFSRIMFLFFMTVFTFYIIIGKSLNTQIKNSATRPELNKSEISFLNPNIPTTANLAMHMNQLEQLKHNTVQKQQKEILLEMKDYDFKNQTNLKNLIKDPILCAIFTTWRSGSTFLGDLIQSHPAMFYHYEPLLHFNNIQVRSGKLATEGLRVMKNLFKCKYSVIPDYVHFGKSHKWLHTHNWRLWQNCIRTEEMCFDSDFLNKMCQSFPFQIMKTVRMRLRLAEYLLKDESLNLKILHLVRDPRAIYLSRKFRSWCPESLDCSNHKFLCSDMVDDFHAAEILRKRYPKRVLIIRYEDISINPYNGAKKVLDFFGLDFHPFVKGFLKSHTVENIGGVSSTFRDSKSTPFRWTQYFEEHFDELETIQKDCAEAMKLWRYKPINTTDFNRGKLSTIFKPSWKEMNIEFKISENEITSKIRNSSLNK